jgi:integrase
MRDLKYELVQLALRNRDGSFQTRHDRLGMLTLMADQLYTLGFQQMHAWDIKGRHVNRLLARWKQEQISHATIRNRLAVLRWWCAKVGRASVMPPTNTYYALDPRKVIARVSKATTVDEPTLERIGDAAVRQSLALQRAFGLRREESLKIKPWQADHGHELVLQGSWTKGGRPRRIPILTEDQRQALDEAKGFVRRKEASLIPLFKTYAQQLHVYTYEVAKVGLSKLHGLRHAYAQRRFLELAGFPCPAGGGPARRELTPDQQEADLDARMILTEEMGHSRTQITTAYIGR